MSQRLNADQLLDQKRELHRRIGRSRRRIDARLRATKTYAQRLFSWRTYVARHPAWSMAAALGAGVAASGAFRSARVARWLGNKIIHRALSELKKYVWSELRRTPKASEPDDKVSS